MSLAPTQSSAPHTTSTTTELGTVGVPERTHPYWLDLLQRCGLRPRQGSASPVMFVPPECDLDRDALDALRTRGVAVVGSFGVTSRLANRPTFTQRVAGVEGTGPLFADGAAIRMPTKIHTADVEVSNVDLGGCAPVIGLPLPMAAAALDAKPAMQEFTVAPSVQVAEIVAGTDHGGVRRLVLNALRLAHEALGLPFVRLGTAPVPFSGSLAIRVDADDFDAESTATVRRALEAAELQATWFIDVERHANKAGGPTVTELQDGGFEVQSHFFHHYTYTCAERNLRNLLRAQEILGSWGVTVDAAVAPFGTYNNGLRDAFRRAGIRWSSEFSATYDDLPTTIHGCPQVPVHPICPSLLIQSGLSDDAVVDYYVQMLTERLARNEPTIIYGHPIGDLDAVPQLFAALRGVIDTREAATGRPVWLPTMSEYKAFFDIRRDQRFACYWNGTELQGYSDGVAPLLVERPGHDTMSLSGEFRTACEAAPRTSQAATTVRPWVPMHPRQLRRRQRLIQFRRWLREVRKR